MQQAPQRLPAVYHLQAHGNSGCALRRHAVLRGVVPLLHEGKAPLRLIEAYRGAAQRIAMPRGFLKLSQ